MFIQHLAALRLAAPLNSAVRAHKMSHGMHAIARLALVLAFARADAVCVDPTTMASGYRLPLATEVQVSDSIVVGEVLAKHPLPEPADPDAAPASMIDIRVEKILKGGAGRIVSVFVEEDSGGYRMDIRERHLLFLKRSRAGIFTVDSCGNSVALSASEEEPDRVHKALEGSAHAP